MDAVVLTHEATGKVLATGFEAVNEALAGTGVRAAPLSLAGVPAEIAGLLAQKVLSAEENARVKAHFLLSRETCLEVIADAGRAPQVPGGGSMAAYCETLSVQYPQLWVIEEGADGSPFYPYHRNMGEDCGSDEVAQLLAGERMRYRYDVLGGVVLTMNAMAEAGVMVTFSGMLPHGGILADTSVGAKILVQVLGPERFWVRSV